MAGGLLIVRSNADMMADEESKRLAEQSQANEVILGLSAYLRKCWQAAFQAKREIQEEMLKCLRQRQGVYEAEDAAEIARQGGSGIYLYLTEEKCTALESWLEDILLPDNGEPWGVKPSPVPDLPPESVQEVLGRLQQEIELELQAGGMVTQQMAEARLMQMMADLQQELIDEAKEENERVELALKDVIEEAGWHESIEDYLWDFCTFPAAFLKGPVLYRDQDLEWAVDGSPILRPKIKKRFYSPSPFDIFPSPGARDVNDGYLLERHYLNRSDLARMKGVPGYDDSAIDLVLSESGRGGLRHWADVGDEQARRLLENRQHELDDPEGKIEALQFWGEVQGSMLREWGMSAQEVPDVLGEYEVEAWLIGRYVIRCILNDGSKLGGRPYFKSCFRKVKGSFWGTALPKVIRDGQKAANAAARALLNNMALSSGPQVGVDVGALPDGEDVTSLYPWKIWQFNGKSYTGSGQQPLIFFQPNSLTAELLKVYEWASTDADNRSGIPRYAYGQGATTGALGTASGYSMMLGNATKGIKRVVKYNDRDVIAPSITRTHRWELLYGSNPDFKRGDIKLVAKGSSTLVVKEQAQVRRNELLQIVSSSQFLQGLVGEEGGVKLFRDIVRGLDIGVDGIVPSEAEMRRRKLVNQIQAAMAAQAQQLAIQAQAQGGQDGKQGGNEPRALPQGTATDAAGAKAGGADARTM